jgi:hypothetical protein
MEKRSDNEVVYIMSKLDRPYVPPRVSKHTCEAWYPDSVKSQTMAMTSEIERSCPAGDDDAEYIVVVGTDSSLASGLTPPIHAVCDSCWKPAMEPCGWTVRGEGAFCCFCGMFTAGGKQVAYWALDAVCQNKH